jgi:CubicO group peptidase (beta-lactamase class C family)
MRKHVVFVLSFAISIGVGQASAQPVSHQFTSSMSSRIDAIGKAEVASGRTPGIAIGVVEDGRLVYARGFGFANAAKHLDVAAATQFYIGSISKQFTAAAILLLVQDGKVKLDDKVTKLVPELTIASSVTIAQLLQQTSGLPNYTRAPGIVADPTRSIKLAALIAAVDKMTMRFDPGTKFEYNNFNYFIAGLIVERASGLPLSDFLQARIFQPLYMTSTFYASDNGISPSHAVGYTGGPHHFTPAKPWDPTWLLGAGGLVSNVYDLAKWDVGMPVLMRVDAVRNMFTASGAPGAQSYGMGWVVDQRNGKRYIWHNGELGGYHSMNALLPDDHIAVIVLANADDISSKGTVAPETVAAQVLDVASPPTAAHLDNAIVARAREWLGRIADRNLDRTQLTPAFSAYLTDQLVSRSNFRALGKIQTFVPVSSTTEDSGDTTYEFLVRFTRGQFHYRMSLTKQGKIDGLVLAP